MVSPKWTCQLSFGLALPIAAAQPPSAITVWALPNNDLHDHRDLQTTFARLDHRTQTRAAGTDHDHVVLVPFDLSHIPSLAYLLVNQRWKCLLSQ